MLAEQKLKRDLRRYSTAFARIFHADFYLLVPKLADSVQEIRLRLSRPLALVCPDNTYYLTQNVGLSNTILDGAMLGCFKSRYCRYIQQHLQLLRI